MHESAFASYLSELSQNLKHGDATEHTHRPALKTLLESLAKGIVATNEPTRILCGAPDFNITKGKVPLGHVETKDIGENLTQMERGKPPHGDQFARYRDGLPNWILTDYLEFRWYVNGEHRLTARLADVDTRGKLRPTNESELEVAALLDAFLRQKTLTIGTARDLAERMAGMTRIIRDLIIRTFEHEVEKGFLHTWLAAFREVLIPDLDEKLFADMFAQTLAYGLFAARIHTPPSKEFSREMAAYNLPKTNPFLRKLFSEIAGVDMPETIAWAVDDIVELLKHADMFHILQDFGKGQGKEDPVVHFYETFLAAYDPKMREVRGVYYTPEPVVSYIVRSVDYLLKKDFELTDGLADATKLKAVNSAGTYSMEAHKVQILDPATGTGTFLYSIVDQIYETFKSNKGMWSSYVTEHLLPRLFGFELLMAPYTVAHMKLGLQLKQTGYDVGSNERLGVYLTNTLEEGFEGPTLPFAQWLVEEAEAAGNVKYDFPVMVVFGNPPYSGHSANSSWRETKEGKKVPTFIGKLVQDYYKVDGASLGERNPKWLQDDYVKFIRFAQWRIERTGYGILAFITNHGYLDNPTFRGMRQNLMQSFDEIYVLDLHGSSKKKERSPDGTKDENVFDIMPGVAISIFVKRKRQNDSTNTATIYHSHLWGMREIYEKIPNGQHLVSGKYLWLWENSLATTQWTEVSPEQPFYFFIPQDIDLREEYEKGWKVTEILPEHSSCMNTARDSLVIDVSKHELIIECLYRPFDRRWLFHHPSFIDRPRTEVNSNMLKKNISLVTTRQTKEPFGVVATNLICGQHKIAAVYDRSYFFPLY